MRFTGLAKLLTSSITSQLVSSVGYAAMVANTSTAEIGKYSTTISTLTIAGIIASLRIDQMILSARQESEAKNLLLAGVISAVTIPLVLLTLVQSVKIDISQIAGGELAAVVYLVACVLTPNIQSWAQREGRLDLCAKGKLVSAISFSGLILASTISNKIDLDAMLLIWISSISLLSQATVLLPATQWKELRLEEHRLVDILGTVRRYKSFATEGLAAGWISSVSIESPQIIIRLIFGSEAAGFYAISFKILSFMLPSVISTISQKYYVTTRLLGPKSEKVQAVTIDIVNVVSGLLFPLMTACSIALLAVSQVVDSGRWTTVSTYMLLMSFSASCWITSQPLNNWYVLLKRQRSQLIWNLEHLLVKTMALLLGSMALKGSPELSIAMMSVASSWMYIKKCTTIFRWIGIEDIRSKVSFPGVFFSGAGAMFVCILIGFQSKIAGSIAMMLLVALFLGCYTVLNLVRLDAVSALVHLSPKTKV